MGSSTGFEIETGHNLILTIGTVERISSPDPDICNRRAAARARLASLFKYVTTMDGLPLASEQVALCAPQRNAFLQHRADSGMQTSKLILRECGG